MNEIESVTTVEKTDPISAAAGCIAMMRSMLRSGESLTDQDNTLIDKALAGLAKPYTAIAAEFADDPDGTIQKLIDNADVGARFRINLYRLRVDAAELERARLAKEQEELGEFFGANFSREIFREHMHANKSTNEVIFAYLRKYYLRPRDHWWGKFMALMGKKWGIR